MLWFKTMKDQVSEFERPILIGWKEYVHFPEWSLPRIKAKIDTGAYTSALDTHSYELRELPGHNAIVEIHLPRLHKGDRRERILRVPLLGRVLVRNTGGTVEERPLVETTIRLGPALKRVRLTLTSRSGLRYRMILGRTALESDFIVDVSKRYLLGKK
jgi:hypothetical protein